MTGQFTEGLISACERLPVTDKSRWMMTDAEKKAGVFDFRRRFRDFSANQLRTALQTDPDDVYDLFELMAIQGDEDAAARVYGNESRIQTEDDIRRLINDLK